MNDIWEKAESLLELGKEESFKKNYIGAIKHFEEAQKQFLQCKDSLKIASCLAELALAHYNNNKDRLIRCLTLLNDARSLIDGLENKNYTEANILRYYGIIYYSERRYSESIRYYRNAQRLVEKNSLEYARTLDCLAVFYLRNNDYQVSNKYLKESLKLKIESQNKREILITKLLYGRFLASAENYDEAQSYFKDVLDELSRYGENATTARVQDELAKIYLALQNYEEAENLCVKSIELAQKLDKSLLKAFSYCTLAHLRIIKGNANEALEILKLEVKPIFAKETSVRGFGLLKRLQSLAYYALGDMKQAIEKSHEAIELFKEAGVSIDIVKSYFELSKIYKKADDVSMSMTCLLESLKIARINNDTLWAKKVEDFIFEIDEHEWASIVNKVAQKSSKAPETKPLLDTLTLIGDIAKPDVNLRDPLLSLLKIGRSIAAETSLDKLLEIIAEETKVALNADRCTVFLLDKESNELWSKVALGMGKQEIRFPANMGLAGHVASTGETINITDAYNDPRFNKEIDKKTGYTTKTILCMPMRNLSHDIIGVFQVLNKAGNKVFNDSDEDLLVAIGSSAGIGARKTQVYLKNNNKCTMSLSVRLSAL
ncbi:MAG: tetratricopeptide repeat protein [Ignavibacteriales bacterium]|nr:tetratricopeptide repeat protein [Ignavibacteriales bacterium]